jgi:hypothetical protein
MPKDKKRQPAAKPPRGKPVRIPVDFDRAMEGLLKVPPGEVEKEESKEKDK